MSEEKECRDITPDGYLEFVRDTLFKEDEGRTDCPNNMTSVKLLMEIWDCSFDDIIEMWEGGHIHYIRDEDTDTDESVYVGLHSLFTIPNLGAEKNGSVNGDVDLGDKFIAADWSFDKFTGQGWSFGGPGDPE